MRAVVAVLLLMLTMPLMAFGQFSPGPLSNSHAHLEGVAQCSSCHSFGLGRQELKCSTCHTEIAERIKNKRGYHGSLVDTSRSDTDCVACHKEHAGRKFELIRWPSPGKSGFNHASAGYPLEGKHGTLQCGQCHNEKNISSARKSGIQLKEKSGIQLKDLNETFLGLGSDCLSCHSDFHRGQLGANCTSCHSQDAWKPVLRFDHKLTRFPLTGLHTAVACQQCHKPAQAGTAIRYSGINFGECSACHHDPHGTVFGAECTRCHSTTGWKVAKTTLTSRFDHSRTRYPLLGKHASLDCASCHKTTNFSTPIASGRCLDCHKDRHDNQFVARADRGDCGSCHSVEKGFESSTFDLKAHMSSRYPLEGKHATVVCKECHEKKGRSTNYHPAFASCSGCHKDAHADQFLVAYGNKCETCHVVTGFVPSTFTLVKHKQSRFDLKGAHVAVACSDCHGKDQRNPHEYVFSDRSCVACHRDPHSLDPSQKQCEGCHTLTAWTPALRFDHTSTRFALRGAHRTVECLACHKPAGTGSGKEIRFSGTAQQCVGCHEDVHLGQFSNRMAVGDCSSCHSTLQWKGASGFDHSKSDFSLDGAHQKVRCILCHNTKSQIKGRETLVYRDAPTECKGCH